MTENLISESYSMFIGLNNYFVFILNMLNSDWHQSITNACGPSIRETWKPFGCIHGNFLFSFSFIAH